MLKVLEESGIPSEAITILISTGMHRPNLGEELDYMLGREIARRYRIVNHSCRDASNYRKIDEIDGAPIQVNRHYLDADLRILTGLIEPHFYAGYSGVRKAILPGISSFETMKFMHSYRLIEQPKVSNCILDGNPFHEYGLRVSQLAGVDFILNVVINKERKVAGVFAGHYDQAHRAGCELARAHFTVERTNRPTGDCLGWRFSPGRHLLRSRQGPDLRQGYPPQGRNHRGIWPPRPRSQGSWNVTVRSSFFSGMRFLLQQFRRNS